MLSGNLEYKTTLEDLKNYKINLKNKLIHNLDNVSNEILENSREIAPIDIGIMRENSGYYTKELEESGEIISYVGFMEFYAVYVHQGTGLFALNGDGRQTPWWWKGTTEKWEGWHRTTGQRPKQFLWDTYIDYIEHIPILLTEGLK